jgi:hypothetical protein
MAAYRQKVCDGQEWLYRCGCGFSKFLSPECGCEACRKYAPDGAPWPLERCPLCGGALETKEPPMGHEERWLLDDDARPGA